MTVALGGVVVCLHCYVEQRDESVMHNQRHVVGLALDRGL